MRARNWLPMRSKLALPFRQSSLSPSAVMGSDGFFGDLPPPPCRPCPWRPCPTSRPHADS
eukprot:7382657-Prymnesium_polylepis.2